MINQQAMQELKELLIINFPDYVENVILFGSQTTKNARDYSDYDVLVILKKEFDWKFRNKIYDKTWEIDFKYDILTDIKLISSKDIDTVKGKQPFVLEALEHGIVL